MKRCGLLIALILPIASFGAPSVRMLGTQPAMVSAASHNAKAVSLKSPEASNVSSARIGSLQTKAKSNTALSIASANSESRFPVVSSMRSYNSVKAPKVTGSYATTTANVDVEAIVDSVTQRIENSYYNKQEVDDKLDDPRFDAIKIGTRPSHSVSLPRDYVYMWIEENN